MQRCMTLLSLWHYNTPNWVEATAVLVRKWKKFKRKSASERILMAPTLSQ